MKCAGCGGEFRCDVEAGDSRCWCFGIPVKLPVPAAGAACYCPACLGALQYPKT